MDNVLDRMDREISPEKLKRRKIFKILISGSVLIMIIVAWTLIYGFIKPDLKRSEIKTAIVERGDVYSSITASGIVEAEYMNTLLAPFSAKIIKIRKPSGSRVHKGDTILILDQVSVSEELKNLKDQLALNMNSYRQSNLNVDNEQLELDYQLEVKKMNIANLETSLHEEEQLFAVGGTSEEKIRNIRQQLDLANKELTLALNQNKIRINKTEAELEALNLNIRIKERELAHGQKLYDDSWVIAPDDGVIIRINGREGQSVITGQEMVTLSDLSTYKLTGKISDSNADKLQTNGKVIAVSNKIRIAGTIGNIRPEIENGMIKFDVFLEQNNHPDLHPNLSMELQVVTGEKAGVLRLPDGPFFDGSKQIDVFVVEGNNAYKKKVTTGLNNFEYVEIASGLEEGDEVIISDVSKVNHLETIKIK
ncbi:MAG TPA: HlyD family efflux transporter periplasmic adaptor subunit [Bacteroidales bacterium]|nr:HlyD family efflux transporter periplasmic adaptor subunit [Bacteroidales bacterium]